MKSTIILLLLSLCLISCGKKETEISGEVFVVTQGAGNYKLGLVEISAIPEKDIQPFVTALQLKEAEEIKTAQAAYDKAKKDTDSAIAVYSRSVNKYTEQSNYVDTLKNSDHLSGEDLNKGFKTLNDMNWTEDENNKNKKAAESSNEALLKAKIDLLNAESPERYFTDLPKAITTSTTNSDGKFSLKIPLAGKYALFAKSTRKVGDKNELYYWIVTINANGQPQNLILSNNNTTDSGSPDSLIKSKTLEF